MNELMVGGDSNFIPIVTAFSYFIFFFKRYFTNLIYYIALHAVIIMLHYITYYILCYVRLFSLSDCGLTISL